MTKQKGFINKVKEEVSELWAYSWQIKLVTILAWAFFGCIFWISFGEGGIPNIYRADR